MPAPQLPRLYAILDPDQTRGRDCREVLQELLQGGASVIQLRAKTLPPREILELARALQEPIRRSKGRLLINDRLDIALACGADGVHLGQDDLPLSAARKITDRKIIGISTHNERQAREAERAGADYIGFGPIFGSNTKDTGYGPRGLDRLCQIRQTVRLPIVAIGGINEDNVAQVWRAGADAAAIISDILSAEHIPAKVARILGLAQAEPAQAS
jgi:thiamine-phosphate pyrophosphorylase